MLEDQEVWLVPPVRPLRQDAPAVLGVRCSRALGDRLPQPVCMRRPKKRKKKRKEENPYLIFEFKTVVQGTAFPKERWKYRTRSGLWGWFAGRRGDRESRDVVAFGPTEMTSGTTLEQTLHFLYTPARLTGKRSSRLFVRATVTAEGTELVSSWMPLYFFANSHMRVKRATPAYCYLSVRRPGIWRLRLQDDGTTPFADHVMTVEANMCAYMDLGRVWVPDNWVSFVLDVLEMRVVSRIVVEEKSQKEEPE